MTVSPDAVTRRDVLKGLLAAGLAACGVRGSRVAYGRSGPQFGELALPEGPGPHPVAVLLHGGFWLAAYDLSLMSPLAAALAHEGIAAWNVEYRRVGDVGGGWPGTFEDVAAATDHLRALASARPLDLGRTVAIGHSAGGHLALWLAARHRIGERASPLYAARPLALRGAVSLAGVCDLRRASALGFAAVDRLMGGAPDAVPARYAAGSPAELLPLGVRQVLIHGTDDHVVPFSFSEEYRAAAVARGDDVALVPLPGAGHFEPIATDGPAWTVVRDQVRGLVVSP